jgi:threonine/homoserine/homoserine lactone efflux protein
MGMLSLVLTIVGISLSGVMAPGPITAATLAAGARSRHAGAWICAGHVLVELPLILLLAVGLGTFLESRGVRAGIGLIGGLLLLLMGLQLLMSLGKSDVGSTASVERHPLWIGIILSGANPYFLLWWATVGLTLTSQAMEFGVLALGLFALVHWMCDLGWLEVLSFAGFKGSEAFGNRSQKAISLICAVMLLGFTPHWAMPGKGFWHDQHIMGCQRRLVGVGNLNLLRSQGLCVYLPDGWLPSLCEVTIPGSPMTSDLVGSFSPLGPLRCCTCRICGRVLAYLFCVTGRLCPICLWMGSRLPKPAG